MNKVNYGIAVLTYNHPEISKKCLDSVLKLKNEHTPIFIIHNGSDAKNILLLKNHFPDLIHVILEKNKGYSGGVNFALKTVFEKFDHALFLTNDIEVLKLPDIIPLGFSSVQILKRNTVNLDSVMGSIDIKQGRLSHIKTTDELNQKKISQHLYIPGSAFWINLQTFNLLSGFDESFHTYWEDVDFSYRANLQKINLNYDPSTLVKHKIGKTCHKNDFYTYYLFQRNRKKFMIKHQLTSCLFWFRFMYDILKVCKYRFSYLWRIVYE